MALTTRCPQCHAVFRVVADQLKLRGGLVRCGQCATVFDAISALSYLEDAQLKQALAPRAPPPPTSRPAAPPPAPMAATAAPAEPAATAVALQTSIAPAMLVAAPVVARAEPIEWARLRRAAADSPLLLGGDHAAPASAGGPTGTAADPEDNTSAWVDRSPPSAAAEISASEEPPELPTDAPEIADAGGLMPIRETSLMAPASSEVEEALRATDVNDAPTADEAPGAGESDEPLDSPSAVAVASDSAFRPAAGDSAFEPAAAFDGRNEAFIPAGSAAPGQAEAPASSDEAEPRGGAEPSSDEVAPLDAEATVDGREVADHDAEPEAPVSEGAIREAAARESPSGIKIGGAAAGEDEGDPANRGTALGVSDSDTAVGHPDAAPAEVGFLNSMAQARARRRSWLWGIAAALTAVALAWQLAAALRAEILMRWPQAHALLVRLCQPLGCEVQWPMQPALLAVLASDLQAVPGTSAFELDVTVRNRAPYPQALPAIELTLMDTRGQAIARRVFAAPDYGAPPQGSLAPGADLAARVLFEVKGPAPAGFLVYPFYP